MATRYGVSREDLDQYSLLCQQRTAAAQANGKYDDEIVPMDTVMTVKNKETGEVPLLTSSCTHTHTHNLHVSDFCQLEWTPFLSAHHECCDR